MRSKTPKNISDELKAAIETAGVTKYAIAHNSGVTWEQIHRFMTGQRDLRLESAAKLAESLDLVLVPRSMVDYRKRKR